MLLITDTTQNISLIQFHIGKFVFFFAGSVTVYRNCLDMVIEPTCYDSGSYGYCYCDTDRCNGNCPTWNCSTNSTQHNVTHATQVPTTVNPGSVMVTTSIVFVASQSNHNTTQSNTSSIFSTVHNLPQTQNTSNAIPVTTSVPVVTLSSAVPNTVVASIGSPSVATNNFTGGVQAAGNGSGSTPSPTPGTSQKSSTINSITVISNTTGFAVTLLSSNTTGQVTSLGISAQNVAGMSVNSANISQATTTPIKTSTFMVNVTSASVHLASIAVSNVTTYFKQSSEYHIKRHNNVKQSSKYHIKCHTHVKQSSKCHIKCRNHVE